MVLSKKRLRKRILNELKEQGFKVNPHLRPKRNAKDTYKRIHRKKREEKLKIHKSSLLRLSKLAKQHFFEIDTFDPRKINLEIREVKPDSKEAKLFFWWNLTWWSLPYDKPIGRQMKFIIWDKGHNAPFGLIGLQSPPLRNKIRDEYLGLNKENVDYWANLSMYGQRIGALPPYNELLGGKFLTLALTSNEVRKFYKQKYQKGKTLLSKRELPSDLLFITTTSAYGKSPIYERVKFKSGKNDYKVSKFLGYTSGAGTFHLSESTYKELLKLLEKEGVNVKRGYGTGPSRKLKLIDKAFELLNMPSFTYHNIKRGFYIFPLAKNVHKVIKNNTKPKWFNRKFKDVSSYWKERYCIPRSEKTNSWKQFDFKQYLKKTEKLINSL